MMRRLYFRIYLAVLASIALSVVLAGIAAAIFANEARLRPRDGFFAEVVGVLLPPATASAQSQQIALQRWRNLSGYDLVLLSASGQIIATAGDKFSPRIRENRWRSPFNQQRVVLKDGRQLFAQPAGGPLRGWRGLGFLGALGLVALAVAISAWPVVRRLTRDLENLERSVAAFGAGDLATRAQVRGGEKSRDEVARLAATFNETAARVEALLKSNRSLLANASHELRSPLARMRMAAETLGPDTPPATREEIARNVRELDELIGEILLASRLDARAADELKIEELDLRALAAEECARAGIEIHAGPGSEQPFRGDPRLLRRLMRNLLENAKRYGGDRAEAALYASASGALCFDVCDRGPGVPAHERERIFEPFYRQAGVSEASGGVGLGLALVQQIAHAHGGRASCLERDGGGACFRVEFPMHQAQGGPRGSAA